MTKFLVVFVTVLFALSVNYELGLCIQQHENDVATMKLGGGEAIPNDAAIDSLARFAVQEHNHKENGLLKFVKVLKAKEQVVAGKMYYITLEAIDAGKNKIYEAKIWVKPWANFKQLQEFKLARVISTFRNSVHGIKQDGGDKLGWQEVPNQDPKVKDAANFAVESIMQRSNSLSPYKLLEIVQAKTKVVENYVKYILLLKVSRGIKEESFRVELSKKLGGKFNVSRMEQVHP